jgi:hypothetical protein
MYDALANMPDGTLAFSGMSKTDILFEALHYTNFFDLESGLCNFDSEEFVELLQFVKDCPSGREDLIFTYQESDDEWDMKRNTLVDMFIMEEVLIRRDNLNHFIDIPYDRNEYGADISYIGFPSNERYGSRVEIPFVIAMTTECKNKTEAWEYIKQCYLAYEEPNAARPSIAMSFSTNIHTFNARMEFNNSAPVSDIDGFTCQYPLTEDESDYLWEIIQASSVTRLDGKLWEIIKDEAEYYFAGEKTVEETSKVIQNRVSTYLSEQR